MKRGIKKGTRRSPERIFLESLKPNSFFYTCKSDKDMTALATASSVKIRTERLIVIHPNTLKTNRITKVEIINRLTKKQIK